MWTYLAVARGRSSRAAGTAASVEHRGAPRRAPRIESRPIVGGEGLCLAVDSPESGLVVRGLHAAAAAVLRKMRHVRRREACEENEREKHHLVGVGAAFAAAVALFASNGAAHAEPQAGLRRGAHSGAVPARARGAVVADVLHPHVRSVPVSPLRELAVDGVPRLRLDEAAVRCRKREGDPEGKDGELHDWHAVGQL